MGARACCDVPVVLATTFPPPPTPPRPSPTCPVTRKTKKASFGAENPGRGEMSIQVLRGLLGLLLCVATCAVPLRSSGLSPVLAPGGRDPGPATVRLDPRDPAARSLWEDSSMRCCAMSARRGRDGPVLLRAIATLPGGASRSPASVWPGSMAQRHAREGRRSGGSEGGMLQGEL